MGLTDPKQEDQGRAGDSVLEHEREAAASGVEVAPVADPPAVAEESAAKRTNQD